MGENPAYGATLYFDLPKTYNGKTPVTLSFLDSTGKTVRSFNLHLKEKHAKKLTPGAKRFGAVALCGPSTGSGWFDKLTMTQRHHEHSGIMTLGNA